MAPLLTLPPPVAAVALGDALEQVLCAVLGVDVLPVDARLLCTHAETLLDACDAVVVEPDGVFMVCGTTTMPCEHSFAVPDTSPRIVVTRGGIAVNTVLWCEPAR
jgi:hypothetical protein